jgi:7-cyano-7-deazaguanine synthase
MAKMQGFDIYALSFRYGQPHSLELEAVQKIIRDMPVAEHKIAEIDLRLFGGSALTDNIAVPKGRTGMEMEEEIPVTYVPARNTIFLSFALGWAEVLGAFDIFIGVNAVDYSGYPDCRPEFIKAFETVANLATKAGVEGSKPFRLHTPLIDLSKADIIKEGLTLGVRYEHTLSCYDPSPEGYACGSCDACYLRLKGFEANGTEDPAHYINVKNYITEPSL